MNPKKKFNITGPCLPSKHYMLPVLPRIPGIVNMIGNEDCFILHAPGQSGKTTFLNALTERINSKGGYYALSCSLASLKPVKDYDTDMARVVSAVNSGLRASEITEPAELAYANNSQIYTDDTMNKVKFMLNSYARL
ncbi:MAG: hypothetical protein LBP22_12700 [Deltaproteobacteria bacterium]|jgi:hypothetical protein|nr:hypothetical protein [Deltaproteobacteria bacterium]